MKTALLTLVTFFVLLFGCTIKNDPVEVVLKDSINADITIDLIAEHYDPATTNTGNDYLYSTYSITNNAGKNFDSVKVVFTIGTGSQPTIQNYSYIPMIANERDFVTIFHRTNAPIKTTVRWW